MKDRIRTGVIAIVFFSFAVSSLILHAQEKKHLTFEQIFKGAEPRVTQPLPVISGWLDDKHYLESKKKEGDDRAKVYAVDAETGAETVVRDLRQYHALAGDSIDPSEPAAANETYTRLIYTKNGDLFYLNTEKREFKRLTNTPAEEKNPTLSPDGNFVAFTRNNDLYAIDLTTGKEYRYTKDGSNVIYNGWASWVYFEEILGRSSRYRAFWWSPDSKKLGFYRFNDASVPLFPLFNHLGVHGSLENTRYPEPGDPNPEVRIGIVSVNDGGVVWADFNEQADQYFGMPFWTAEGRQFFVQWMNRRQDTLRIFSVDPATGKTNAIYTEYQPSWVEWFTSINFLKGNSGFVLKTDKDGWSHLYVHSMDGALKNRLTSGRWSVVDLKQIDDDAGKVYFTARKEASTRIDLYSVHLDGSGLERSTSGEFNHSVDVSTKGSYFIDNYTNASTPSRMALCRNSGKRVRDLGDSKTKAFEDCLTARSKLFHIKTPDGYELPALWTLPTDFDSTKKYPVLFSVYGGPNSMNVSDSWGGIREQWLSLEGVIQFSVDHRGSGHFGKDGVALMYRNLGKWEMIDYIEAVKWLRRQSFVDSTRICITGGSYGGYVTCMALTAGADYFTHGIAGSSVTDWLLYDSHYTERYMGLPSENPEGYKNGSVLTYADKYRGMLRIVHGTTDDNVHMQHILQLVDTLEDLNKNFELMIYPNGRHGWGGAKAVHDRNETYRFYYKYLIRKEFPEALFKSVGIVPRGGARRRR
jgi:dipeptidyl-peptidase-4